MKKKSYTVRKLINDLHLWLGIGSGLILFIVCLTGTVLAFEHELEELFESERHHVQVSGKPVSTDSAIAIAESETRGKATGIRIWEDNTKAYQVFVKSSPDSRPSMFLVDQYSGTLKGEAGGTGAALLETMMKLHRWLLLDPSIGRPIVGISTILFIVLCFTGLILWIPKKIKNIRKGLLIKGSAGWKRINYDLHNVLGFYALPLLLVMAFTGLNWSFEWYRQGMSNLIKDEVFKQRMEKPLLSEQQATDTIPLTVEESITLADKQLSYSGNRYIILPGKPDEAIQVRKMKTGIFALASPDKVHLDRFTGTTLKVDKFDDLPFNEELGALMRPLHLGDVFGTFSKILYFVTCLIATTLPITGVIIWINKLRKKNRKKQQKKSVVVSKMTVLDQM